MAIEDLTVCYDTSLFLVGSFPSQFTEAQAAQLPPDRRAEIIIDDTMRRMLDVTAGVLHFSTTDGESLPEQVDWEIGFADKVLPKQEGVGRYRFLPHGARSLLSSPHFYPEDKERGLADHAAAGSDFGARIFEFAEVSNAPFTRVTREYGLHLYNKRDIPVGMSLVYFGLHHLLNTTRHGLREAVQNGSPKDFGNAFEATLKTFDDKFRTPMETAAKRQIDAIHDKPGLWHNVELQFSAPAPFSLAALAKLGNTMKKPLSRGNKFITDGFYQDILGYMAGITSNLLNHTPSDVSCVMHECAGEINPAKFWGSVFHPSETAPWSNQAAVDYVRAVDAQAKPGHKLREVHAIATPVTAEVFEDADAAKRILAPFEDWPAPIRLAAGMARPGATTAQIVRAYNLLQEVRGMYSDVALACGAGRQRPAVAGKDWRHDPLEDLKTQVAAIEELRGQPKVKAPTPHRPSLL